jgi:transposase-like protein
MKNDEKVRASFVQLSNKLQQFNAEDLLGYLRMLSDTPTHSKKAIFHCPHCKSRQFSGMGKQKGIQRYKCKSCLKYFSETTGRIEYCLKKKEKMAPYLQCLLSGFSVRKSAALCGISIHTSFVWRHKILVSLQRICDARFSQILESVSITEPYSEKGQRIKEAENFFIEKSKRSMASGNDFERWNQKMIYDSRKEKSTPVGVLILRDREGSMSMKVARRGKVCKKDLDRILTGKMSEVQVMCSPASRTYAAYMRDKGIPHVKSSRLALDVISKLEEEVQIRSGCRKRIFKSAEGLSISEDRRGVRKAAAAYQITNVLECVLLWKQFMKRFYGVATKYLQNYLNWYILLDKLKNSTIPLEQTLDIIWKADGAWSQYKSGLYNTDFST